jgi:hypothetical protein
LILTVIDEDADGDDGRYYVRNALGFLLRSFDAWYTSYDHVALGDTNGNGLDEIIVASDDRGGMVLFYDGLGAMQFCFDAPVTHYDGLAVADVDMDGKCEILLAKDDNDTVYTYNANGEMIREMKVDWNFKGVRYTHSTTRHDAFLVGNVLGDERPEIVMIENKSYRNGITHIYAADNISGIEVISPIYFSQYDWNGSTSVGKYSDYDGSCLADIMGDSRMELLVATDGGDGYDGYKIKVYDLENGTIEDIRYWPLFTKYDGFAAGDVLGVGRDQILIANDQDDLVYMSR